MSVSWWPSVKCPIRRIAFVAGPLLAVAACSDFLGSGDASLRVESVAPDRDAAGISVLSTIVVRFNADLATTGLSQGVRLEAGGRPVVVDVSLSNEKTLVITPDTPLDFGTEYHVALTTAITSRSGVPLDNATQWTFTTRGLPPPVLDLDSLRHHLEALAHDSMRGRGSGSEDEMRAARYLEDRYRRYGLQAPAGAMIQSFDGISRRGDTLLTSRNVLAEMPGSGSLASEWVVIGAHYDHIGYRDLPDTTQGPNNGADDNASGTVLVLETARVLEDYIERDGMAGTDRRSVLFIAFGAEEEGLLGSCHYVFDAPAVPLERTVAMMNFDMVGRLRHDVLVVSGQETAAEWPPVLTDSNAPGLSLYRPEHSAPSGTDHACFWQAGIPWLGFFTDFHDEYHTPADDVELINFPGLERIGALSIRVLTRLMVVPQAPVFLGPIPDLPTSSSRAQVECAPVAGASQEGGPWRNRCPEPCSPSPSQ